MPKAKAKKTPAEQSARFVADVQKMIDAGELSPTEGAAGMDRVTKAATKPKGEP